MLDTNATKKEIEKFLENKGEFVAIDHLQRLLKQRAIPLEKKRFMYRKLAELYEKKKMDKEVAKVYHNLAESSIVFREKIMYHVLEAKFYVRALDFVGAEAATKKAMAEANVSQRAEIFVEMKEFYKTHANALVKQRRRSQAARVYERLLEMKLSDDERETVKQELSALYEKLGRLKDYFGMKKG